MPTVDRAAVGFHARRPWRRIDVIVPRGGKGLVGRVQAEARLPVFAHLEGVCHVYVACRRRSRHGQKNRAQRQDAAHRRLRRGRDAAGRSRGVGTHLRAAGRDADRGRLRGEGRSRHAARRQPRVKPATEEDWPTEYLDAIIAVKLVDGLDEAIEHIARYGSQHTDAIVTDDQRRGRTLPRPRRQRHRAAQRLDPVRRRRRVRHGRRDRHRHRPLPCARAGRRRAAHHLQIRACAGRGRPAVPSGAGKLSGDRSREIARLPMAAPA